MRVKPLLTNNSGIISYQKPLATISRRWGGVLYV